MFKLLSALALVVVLAGAPVLAHAEHTSSTTMEAKPAKHHGHKGKKHHKMMKKETAPTVAPTEEPAAQ